MASVTVTQYKWAGKWGIFRIRSRCNECDLTTSVLQKMIKEGYPGQPVTFEVRPWLDNIWYCLFRGAWHPPIIMVNGKKFYQFSHAHPLFDRKKLADEIAAALRG
jgi:hypothetical protein